MANIKISELTALTPPDAADLVPVTDSSASQTKRTTVGEIVGIINGDVDVATDGTATVSGLFGSGGGGQPAAIANITTTATSGSLPTANGSVTIANAASPTVAELLEYCVELEAKLEAALAALRTVGVIAT